MTSLSETCPYTFRILGPTTGNRRCVVAGRAWQAYLDCDERADVKREAYLSAFTYGDDFRQYLDATGSTAGFGGVCGATFIWWDIDRVGNIEQAGADTARLCVGMAQRFKLAHLHVGRQGLPRRLARRPLATGAVAGIQPHRPHLRRTCRGRCAGDD